MIKKSKVTSAQPNGTWEGKFGLMYKSEISFENGDAGEYSSKTREQDKFVVGQETEYEFIGGNFPKVKPVYQKPQSFGGGGFKKDDKVQKMIVKQSSLKAAVDFCNEGCSVEDVIKVAQKFSDWVMQEDSKQSNKVSEITNGSVDDLPF
jgi:hypothetical protein